MKRTLESILAAGLLAGSMQVNDAQASGLDWIDRSDPESQCMIRADRVSAHSMEDRIMSPLGLENCATLESYTDDTTDTNPLAIPLNAGEVYDFATTRTQNNEAPANQYTANGLPPFCSFDAQFGVTSCDAPAGTTGEFLVEYNVVPTPGVPGSVNPLFVVYDYGGVAPLNVEGLGVLSSTEVTNVGPFDFTLNTSNNTINRTVRVREGKITPYDTYVLTNKNDVEFSIADCINCYDASTTGPFAGIPGYITTNGNMLGFAPPFGDEGDYGTLQLDVCEVGTSNCDTINVDWEITDVQAFLAGYSSIGPYENVTNPNIGGFAQNTEEVDCQADHTGYLIPQEIYKGQGFEGDFLPAGMGVNSNTGRVSWNIDCDTQGPGFQAFPNFRYGPTGTFGVQYDSVAVPNASTIPVKLPNYK